MVLPAPPHRAVKEAIVQTPAPTDPRGALCVDTTAPLVASAPAPVAQVAQPIFPPKDADAEARRRWLASSPWPEVVFAAAL